MAIFYGYRLALGKANKRQLKKNRRAIIDEFNLYYETEHICTAITMLDKSSLQSGVVKFWTEVVENRFLKRILRMRMKEGLYEVPGSRSPHIRMKDYDVIRIDLDGNMGKIRSLSLDHYFISYLSSSNQNYRSFPVEPRRDPRGRNIGVINYYRESGQEDVCIHLVAVDTERFLISGPRLPTSHSEAKPREFILSKCNIRLVRDTLENRICSRLYQWNSSKIQTYFLRMLSSWVLLRNIKLNYQKNRLTM